MTSSKTIVQQFFTALSQGDFPAVLATFHPEVVLKSDGPSSVPWYGTYHGVEGAQDMLGRLGNNVATQQFEVKSVIGEGDQAVATGSFQHRVNSTGRLFAGDWALVCQVRDGKISSYHFFENTFEAARAFDPGSDLQS